MKPANVYSMYHVADTDGLIKIIRFNANSSTVHIESINYEMLYTT